MAVLKGLCYQKRLTAHTGYLFYQAIAKGMSIFSRLRPSGTRQSQRKAGIVSEFPIFSQIFSVLQKQQNILPEHSTA
jgi:hypothetical protein